MPGWQRICRMIFAGEKVRYDGKIYQMPLPDSEGKPIRIAHDVSELMRIRADAKGLLEAYRKEAIHPVPVKEVSHQGVAAMHRLRSTWLATLARSSTNSSRPSGVL